MLTNKLALVLFAILPVCLAATVCHADHDESVDGDLSGIFTAPDQFVLSPGSNIFIASQQGDPFGRDVDYFTVTIPVGFQLSSVILDSHSEFFNLAFLGLAEGTSFPFNFDAPDPALLLGGIIFGGEQLGTDILPVAGMLGGSQGFTPPLPSGSYTVWLNQTGPQTTSGFNFQVTAVPEPAGLALLGLGSLIALAHRRRR